MNWSQGFFRLWVFMAVLWWALGFALEIGDRQQSDFWNNVAWIIAAPFILLAIGAFFGWVLKGFRKGPAA
jgi:hypothetical protein